MWTQEGRESWIVKIAMLVAPLLSSKKRIFGEINTAEIYNNDDDDALIDFSGSFLFLKKTNFFFPFTIVPLDRTHRRCE